MARGKNTVTRRSTAPITARGRRGVIPGMPLGGTAYSLRGPAAVDPVYNGAFRRRLEVWGRARANDRSVNVIFGTDGSYTDMKGNITIDKSVPPDGKPGDKALATWGLMSHELCHHRWTSRTVWDQFVVGMKKDMAKGQRDAAKAREAMRMIPGYQKAMEAHAAERKLTYEAGVAANELANLQAALPGAAGAELKELKALIAAANTRHANALADAQKARDARNAAIGPDRATFDELTEKLRKATRLRLRAEQVKDTFNIIEDGRIETHLRVHEPLEYNKISLLNRVYPRIPETYSTGDAEVLVPLGASVPTDADGNPLNVVDGPDGEKFVCIPPKTKMKVFTPYPVDLKRQMRAALLAEAVPEFSVPDGQVHPHVAACLDECRPYIDAGVRGNTTECLEASRKVWEICHKHGMWPDPEDTPSNTGGNEGSGQQESGSGESGGQQGDGGQSSQGGGQSGGEGGGEGGQGGGGDGQEGAQTGGGGGQSGSNQTSGDDTPGKGANGTGGKRGGDDQESGDSGNPFGGDQTGADEWNDRGDSGGAGDGTGDTNAGNAEDGQDGGGISAEERNEAEKKKAGSASDKDAAEASKKAEQDAAGDKSREEGQARREGAKGNYEAHEWQAPGDSSIHSRDQISPPGAAPVPRGPMTRYGNSLAAVFEKMKVDTEGPERFQESGRIDRRRLHRVPTGDTRVFYNEGTSFDTDVSVSAVYDLSGSMGGHRQELQDAAVTIDIALKKVKIPHDAWGFDGGHSASHYEFKSFARPDKDAFGTIAGERRVGGGGTPTADAVEFSTARMSQRKEKSRIMMVFTDGMPTSGGTKEAIEKARRQGITVMGCFFNPNGGRRGTSAENDAMKELFGEDYVSLSDISDLAPALGKKLVSLVKSRNRR